jgi:pilus assembly protein Flp/PilA
MIKFTRRLAADRKGATAIEYGLIAALIALGVVGGLTSVKTNLAAKFTTIGEEIAK